MPEINAHTGLKKYSPVASPNRPERFRVGLFFLCFFIFFSSGRLSGGDPSDQLRATMLLVTGNSAPEKEGVLGDGYNWVTNASGQHYEAHDVGALFVMAPAAFVGSLFRKTPTEDWIARPPFFMKAAASLTYAVVAAGGAYFLFLLFTLFHSTRTAFLWSLAFVVTTPFWAFARCGFDVLGGAAGVCMLLWASSRVLLDAKVSAQALMWAFVSLAVAGSFRYSLLPFLGLGLCAVIAIRRKSISFKALMAAAGIFLVLMLPTFAYNFVRMGNPLKPATVSVKYLEGMNALTENPVDGLYGLLFSPNWGLLFYAPEFLLIAGLPFVWKRVPLHFQQMTFVWGGAALGYLVPIAHCVNWPGVVGWGSRYMVPVLPVFFVLFGIAASLFWRKYRRQIVALMAFSFLINLPSALVNWHEASLANASAPWEEQLRYPWARGPRQQIAMWEGFLEGVQGRPLSSKPDWLLDPALYSIIAFPDLWTFRLMRLSGAGLLAGALITAILGAGAVLSCVSLLRKARQPA